MVAACPLHSGAELVTRTHDGPIFVVGPARSGTTLVANVLDRHRNLFSPGETPFFDDVYSRRHTLGDPSDRASLESIAERLLSIYGRYGFSADQQRIDSLFSKPETKSRLLEARSYCELFALFMETQAEAVGKRRWCSHVPRDAFNAKEIDSCFPDARFVYCIRDPRDYLVSYRNKWRSPQSAESVERLKAQYHPVLTSLLWRSTVRQLANVESVVGPDRLLLVRYEELVAEPRVEIERVTRFAGEQFEDGQLEIDSENSSFDITESGIFTTSVGRWRRELAREEAWIIQTIARRELARLGYEAEPLKVSLPRVTSAFLGLPMAAVRALNAHKKVRGPLLPYLLKRVAGRR